MPIIWKHVAMRPFATVVAGVMSDDARRRKVIRTDNHVRGRLTKRPTFIYDVACIYGYGCNCQKRPKSSLPLSVAKTEATLAGARFSRTFLSRLSCAGHTSSTGIDKVCAAFRRQLPVTGILSSLFWCVKETKTQITSLASFVEFKYTTLGAVLVAIWSQIK